MSFCQKVMISSDAEMNLPFPPPGKPAKSVFPTSGLNRDGDGRLSSFSLQSIYDALLSQKRLISGDSYKIKLAEIKNAQANMKSDDMKKGREELNRMLNDLPQTETQTFTDLKDEFCHTYSRYRYALDQLFTKLASTSGKATVSESDKAAINMYLSKAKDFNIKLNDLIQVSNYLASKRVQDASQQSSEVNALNENISAVFGSLKRQSDILNKEHSEAELRQRMVEYTQEKNRSTNSLLQLYGVLNIVAVGLLLYIYRS
jgi:hypothetical protein